MRHPIFELRTEQSETQRKVQIFGTKCSMGELFARKKWTGRTDPQPALRVLDAREKEGMRDALPWTFHSSHHLHLEEFFGEGHE